MQFVFDDGGRAAAGYKGEARDCVCRAIAIGTSTPYEEVYAAMNDLGRDERITERRVRRSTARNGVLRVSYDRYLKSLGWRWTPTMWIGSGCRVHLADGELPMGRLIVRLSRHLTAVLDGVIHDTHDPQRTTLICENGVQRIAQRCVYGYYQPPV